MSLAAHKTVKEESHTAAVSVQEKILLEKQLPFNPDQRKGPTVELYFHELAKGKTVGQKTLQVIANSLLTLVFVATLPLVAALIKLSSSEPIFARKRVTGRRGVVFTQYVYPTEHSTSERNFWFGSLLFRSGLYKLPSVINVWQGNMNLVGPQPYPVEYNNQWNQEFSDFYKRFSFKPGLLSVADPITNPTDATQMNQALQQELRYVLNPSFKKDCRRLIGRNLN